MQSPIEFHLPSVTSTNDYARELLGTYPYVFVSALHQTAGRGRKGREWIGDFGANVYCSFGLRHDETIATEDLAAYMARGALTVLSLLKQQLPGHTFILKYPNDVLVRTDHGWSKIAGILVEHDFHGSMCVASIIGIGVNVDQEQFPDTITQDCTSMRTLGASGTIQQILKSLRDGFTELRNEPWHHIHSMWVDALQLDTFVVTLAGSNDTYSMIRVMHDGRLVLRNDNSQIERIVSDGDTLRYQDRPERR